MWASLALWFTMDSSMAAAADNISGTDKPLPPPRTISWAAAAWFAALLLVCYAPILLRLARQWYNDQDMGHGFFVPVIAGYIAWLKREELLREPASPTWWGLPVVLYGGLQLLIATLGVELFLARTAFIISLAGAVLLMGGVPRLRVLAFP